MTMSQASRPKFWDYNLGTTIALGIGVAKAIGDALNIRRVRDDYAVDDE